MASLTTLPPELIHNIALTSHLSPSDVSSLSQTCTTLASILLHDPYAHALHRALLGVLPNLHTRHYTSARYAATRRWFSPHPATTPTTPTLWKRVAETVLGKKALVLSSPKDRTGWESVLFHALSLLPPTSTPHSETWKFGRTTASLLIVAASIGSTAVADWALERGAKVDVGVSRRTHTPLYVACVSGHLGVARSLVQAGADVRTAGGLSQTLLHTACLNGNVDLVAYLLSLGVLDVDRGDRSGITPLSVACRRGHLDVVRFLLEESGVPVDVDVEGTNPKGPLYWGCRSGNVDIVRLLLDAGAGSGIGEKGGVWVEGFVTAAEHGHQELVTLLLGMMESVDVVDEAGNTALCGASRGGFENVVRMLVQDAGADVNKPGNQGKTPLFFASQDGWADVVRALLELGADPQIPDHLGRTPASVACRGAKDLLPQ